MLASVTKNDILSLDIQLWSFIGFSAIPYNHCISCPLELQNISIQLELGTLALFVYVAYIIMSKSKQWMCFGGQRMLRSCLEGLLHPQTRRPGLLVPELSDLRN
jgi:hypothetical protein